VYATIRAEGHLPVVLVVEHDTALLASMRGALEAEGHTLLEARTGDEALLLAAHHQGRIDVLVIDLGLPQLDATAVAQIIERTRRGILSLYVSGPIGASPIPGEPVLRKPFTTDELVLAVRELVSA
jgi:two-component system cell cycle sensor histidine kinase/response regulator CckA